MFHLHTFKPSHTLLSSPRGFRGDGDNRDALGRCRAFELTHAAADAAQRLHGDLAEFQFDGRGTEGAFVDADRALLAVGSQAACRMPDGCAHVNVVDGGWLEGAAGTGRHALKAGADDARCRVGVDIGNSARLARLESNRLGRADPDAIARAAARFAKLRLRQRTGRPQPDLRARWNGLIELSDLPRHPLQRLGRRGQRTQ